ncbi:putative disease resistance protein RGA3 [Phragmites australis]|uniref:putative disease resistance protein RGA3 n=1 Tax=Phragmites australis TaxID=29695 RepID=UPI002D7A1FC8|nr:putative disease resistance protein RGA3 [Phragmites australis]
MNHLPLLGPSSSLVHCSVSLLLSRSPAMELLLSAIATDVLSRALYMVIQKYRRCKAEETEQKLQRLQRVLLRIAATVEEAEGRHITNQAMLRQLEMLRQGMYGGHYMLDTFRYRGHGGDEEVSGGRAVPLPRFSSAKRLLSFPVSGNSENMQTAVIDAESVKKLEKMLDGLEKMIGDVEEFAMFLEGYPRICWQPYNAYLMLDKVMFGRQMEKETIINFLLQPEGASNGNPGVLPIVGVARVGKSTLVEHVCLDERVRGYFSSIVLFTGDDAGSLAALKGSGVIKHQTRTAPSCGRSLVVIELAWDMEEDTWRKLYSSAASSMGHGSKIIITSRAEKIVALGTTQALRLKVLPQEAYWYFFKALAFWSTNPDDQPKLASLGMEIAVLLNGSFLGANVVGSLMRTNFNAQFWRRVLQCLRDFRSKHLLMFGEDPTDLLRRDQPVYIWRMARTRHVVKICKVYEKRSPQHGDGVPKLTAQDILTGRVTHQGKFCMVSWRSRIPPYYTYLASCVSQTAECSTVNKKRPRKPRV